jgi:CHAT domain-containing protein/tetratricopeptide (TPR) repeat protein
MTDDILQRVTQLHEQTIDLYMKGQYEQAILIGTQAIILARHHLGEDKPIFATSLNNLAEIYHVKGDHVAAEMIFKQAAEGYRSSLGDEHPLYAQTLSNLASLYNKMGMYRRALPLHQQALRIRREALGEDHPDVANSCNNLALLYFDMGNYSAAEPLYRQSLEIQRTVSGEDDPFYAQILNNLGALYTETGDYAEAERLYQRAMEIRRTVLGEEHPDYARSLYNLAMVNAATHREAEAIQSMREVLEIEDRIISQVFSIGSESQRMAYLKLIRNNVDAFLSLIVEHFCHATTDRQTALNLVLRRKAIGAEALAVQRDAVLGGHYPMLSSRLRALTTLRMQIAAKILSGPGPEGSETHQQVLAEWNSQREQLEGDLVHQIPEMSLKPQLQMADCQAVAKALPEESILIELVRFIPFDFRAVVANGESFFRQPHYLAFVMHAGEPDDVRMVDLGEAEPIDRVIVTFRNSITREGEDRGVGDTAATANGKDRVYERDPAVLRAEMGDYSQGLKGTRGLVPDEEDSDETLDGEEGIRLRAAVFDKLVPHLGGSTRLFVAPDGELYRLPFEALPTSDGQRLIDEYRISYLGSGRDVLRFAIDSAVQAQPPLVAVDPDFDMGSTDAPSSSQTVGFRRLSGTKKEGERIAQMLGVTPLVGDGPLEATVKNARSPRILHIATHGFFRPDTPRDPNAQAHEVQTMSALDGGLLARLAHVENPLLRSGLALVGANTWLKGGSLPEEAEDGILMAEDVTGMDLLATELAVLSACQTGLGEVHSGEGVYGLRRAFVVAGAKTLVMSLWKVPDEQTRELMEDFYRRLLRGTPRVEALRKAQLEMKNKHADPFYWGAFICQGDAGPLS